MRVYGKILSTALGSEESEQFGFENGLQENPAGGNIPAIPIGGVQVVFTDPLAGTRTVDELSIAAVKTGMQPVTARNAENHNIARHELRFLDFAAHLGLVFRMTGQIYPMLLITPGNESRTVKPHSGRSAAILIWFADLRLCRGDHRCSRNNPGYGPRLTVGRADPGLAAPRREKTGQHK